MSNTTLVLVIDEQQMIADTMQRVIDVESDLSVLRALTNDHELSELIAECAPDVVVLDSDVNGGDGPSVARRIRERCAQTQIVMLLNDTSGPSAREAIAAGCLGVISKNRSADDLCNAIRSVARGQAVASVGDLDGLFRDARASALADGPALTDRQVEILALMAEGFATDAIASQLYLSRNTVRSHVQQLFRRLGAKSKLEAVAIARRRGLLR